MAIPKSLSTNPKNQLTSRFPIDRVPKDVACIPYAVGPFNIFPSAGKVSFSSKKVSQVTSISISSITLLGANIEEYLRYTTEGGICFYEKSNADTFAIFKVSLIEEFTVSGVPGFKMTIDKVLTQDSLISFSPNTQLCYNPIPAPTSEALASVDGGYY